MPKSSQLPLPVIRAVFDLIGECCELGADPAVWRDHLLVGMTRQLNCKLAIGGRADLSPNLDRPSMLRSFGDTGWASAAERSAYLNWISSGRPEENPVSARIAATRTVQLTATRREFVDDRTWHGAPLIQSLSASAHVDDVVFSFSLLEGGRYLLLVGQREIGDWRFDSRDRKILELIGDEVRRHLGGKLEMFDAPSVSALSGRLRMTLRCLMEGDSEKQAASRMGISIHTTHEHVKRLHRHFHVASRGELLVKCRRFWPILERDRSPEL